VKGMFVKAGYAYDAEHDLYRCPAGDALLYRYTNVEDGLRLRRYWTSDCQNCPIKERCTTGKERRITRWQHEHLVENMAKRVAADSSGMLTRRSTVEHPFGTIKAWMGATHFQTPDLRLAIQASRNKSHLLHTLDKSGCERLRVKSKLLLHLLHSLWAETFAAVSLQAAHQQWELNADDRKATSAHLRTLGSAPR
jgi:Transposase DDE domain